MTKLPNEQQWIKSSFNEEDITFEVPLRPQTLKDFCGQEHLKEQLSVYIEAAKLRSDPLGHVLLSGPPGLGKTTLANIIAREMGTNIVITAGPIIEKPSDLAGILTNLKKGDVLFIDEIHRLNRAVEEYLYPAMEDFSLDLLIDSGPHSRSVQVKLNAFTLVGATTRMGLLTAPMRSRFGMNCRLDYYEPESLVKIIQRSSNLLQMTIEFKVALEIAKRSRGTPRIANNLLRWVRDYAQIKNEGIAEIDVVHKALEMLQIDHHGLDEMDKKILRLMIHHYSGGPVGLNTLAVAIGEDRATVEEVYEPYLITQGFIKRTPRGREVTQKAYDHLGL